MKLIVGLGNPGSNYINTRHNIGFLFIDQYAKLKNCGVFKAKFKGEVTSFIENGEQILLFKPLTYMNLSGEAVLEISTFYHIANEDIVVVYDDKDIPFAALRLREKGNPGSHNGMKNITELLHSNDFKRIRVGIGTPYENQSMADFVLSKFSKDELGILADSFNNLNKAMDLFIANNFNKAMNDYNFRKNA